MTYRFTDIPVFIPAETYSEGIRRMVDRLLATGKVKCVYQVGGVSSPGISDIDLYVIFKDNVSFNENPVQNLDYPDSYFFTHRLFGTCERHAVKLEQFTLFKKYELAGGDPIPMNNYFAGEDETIILKHQIALEYLVKAWYSNAISMKFQTLKIRNFLLHAKAILLDLEFLNIRTGNLTDCIREIMDIRNKWFHHQPSNSELNDLVNRYDLYLLETINDCITTYRFYLPATANQQLSKRVFLNSAARVSLTKKGITLPSKLTTKSQILGKIQNRLNSFQLNLPCESREIPLIIIKRHEQIKAAFEYNHRFLPAFICTGHGMNLFKAEI